MSRMVLAGVALWTGSADWEESSVKAVNAFIYTRLLIRYIGPLMKTSEDDVPSQQGVYKYVVPFFLSFPGSLGSAGMICDFDGG